MAHIVLFHSVLGLRPIEGEFAAVFEADGHVVTLPDLYGGKAADDYDAGFALRDEVGDAVIDARAEAAMKAVPEDAVLAGVSFGTVFISRFCARRPEAAGLLFYAGVAPWEAAPRAKLPVSAHCSTTRRISPIGWLRPGRRGSRCTAMPGWGIISSIRRWTITTRRRRGCAWIARGRF
ncbi:dienelactone hydrolase family protein [Pelagibacterium mangrovi]|uniref:dienelactone hydrolase family protein n=1 Tax=Pelagibacterium mangrovi TaxID=3119828 RepID=UPI002FC89A8F